MRVNASGRCHTWRARHQEQTKEKGNEKAFDGERAEIGLSFMPQGGGFCDAVGSGGHDAVLPDRRGCGWQAPAPDYPAKVEFRNAPGDRILSIGDSIYRDGETNSEGVVDVTAKIVATTGGLSFDTQYCTRQRGWVQVCSSLGRYHFFDFCQAVNTVNPLPTANGWVDGTIPAGASFMTDPLAADGVTRLPNGFKDVMSFPGEQRLSAMKANFTDSTGSSVFTLRFTPNSYPESNYLLVTYRGGSLGCGAGTPCASWTVEALDGPVDPQTCFSCAAGNLQAIAALQDNSTYYGAFHMPFMITITVLPTP